MSDTNLYAVVEIMGHRTRAGAISDATIGGAPMLRIEHPTAADHTGAEPVTEYYAPQALFGVRVCSREEAEKVAAWAWRVGVPDTPALPAAAIDVEHGDERDYSEEDIW